MFINISQLIHQMTVFFFSFRMPAPKLPTWQDCHELWSKKRRRQQREQESLQNLPSGKPNSGVDGAAPN